MILCDVTCCPCDDEECQCGFAMLALLSVRLHCDDVWAEALVGDAVVGRGSTPLAALRHARDRLLSLGPLAVDSPLYRRQ